MTATKVLGVLIVVLAVAAVIILARCFCIVPDGQAYIVERSGAYRATWKVGIHFKDPFIDRVACRIDLQEQCLRLSPISVVTKDHVAFEICAVFFYRVGDPKLFFYGTGQPLKAVEGRAAAALRSILEGLTFREVQGSMDAISARLLAAAGNSARACGIRMDRVELKGR